MDVMTFISDMMLTDAVILKVLLGAVFGLCLGLTGVGGGVLLIPMLQLFCGMPPVLAVGTASLISAMVKVNASFFHVKEKNVSWKQVSLLFAGAVPVTILVTQIVVYFNQHPIHGAVTQSVVSSLVIAVMAGSLMSVIIKFKSCEVSDTPNVSGTINRPKALLSGAFCGSVMGSTGVGGGVLLLPVLNSVLHLDIKKSIGSSIVLALFLSTVAAVGYAKGGQTDIATAIWFVIGSFVGVPVAARLMKQLSDKLIYLITLSVIAVSLMMYLFSY